MTKKLRDIIENWGKGWKPKESSSRIPRSSSYSENKQKKDNGPGHQVPFEKKPLPVKKKVKPHG